ncbi:MAG: XRE family transcriptional regulator [Desulfomonilaceae bacterium]
MMDDKKYSSDALKWMYNEFIGNDPERIASYQEERIKAEIARQVYDIREQAALTQKQLADLVGTTESVIDDLEEADYEGDALSMLVRIATALRKKIDVQFVTSSAIDPAETSA